MELQVQTISGSGGANAVTVPDPLFGADYNEALVHQVVTAYMAGARRGTKAQKTRSDVRGGGQKPWRQKGTGRARAGTSRSPIWRGGGRAFAASPRNYKQKVNRKMYRAALRSIMSELVRSERLVIVDALDVEQPKTKLAIEILNKLDARDVLLVCDDFSENLFLAARNIKGVGMVDVDAIDPLILVSYDKVVVTAKALETIEAMLQ